jgi:DNA-binding transcriptional MerR regulator
MSIGEVLERLRPEFPEVSISKIRFLEEQGLVDPERSPSGYRRFSHADLERLHYVLSVQRDHYLPLRVIREQLEAIDRGREASLPGRSPRGPRLVGPGETRLTRAELASSARADEHLLAALESFGLIAADPTTGTFDGEALVIARTAGELAAFGIEPRHLRAFRTAAEREAGLIEQAVSSSRRQHAAQPAGHAEETAREIAALTVRLHAALLKSAVNRAVAP